MTSLKICLTISLVSSSHALISSSLIPLRSGDVPFLEFWDSHHTAVHIDAALIFIFTDFLFSFFLFIVIVIFFVEFTKDIGNSLPRRDDLSFFILYLGDEHSSLCRGMFFTPLKSSSIRWMSCCLFIFFVPETFFVFAHFFQTLFLFFGCVSSLLDGLLISTSSFDISSVSFAAAVSSASSSVFSLLFMSRLTFNTMEPSISSERVHCAGSSSPGYSVSITLSVCSPFASSRLNSVESLPSRSVFSFVTRPCRARPVRHVARYGLPPRSLVVTHHDFCFRFCIIIFCLRFCIFAFCLRCSFFCVGGFFFNFFNDLLVSFSELRLLNSNVFLSLIPPFMLCCIELSFFCLAMATLFHHECCHDTSVVTAHVDHVVGFSIFDVFQETSLGYDVVNLLLVTFWRSAGRLFPTGLSVHRVECCEALQHQPMIHPVTAFVSSVECVFANTCTFGSGTKSQFCIEVGGLFAVVALVLRRLHCPFFGRG